MGQIFESARSAGAAGGVRSFFSTLETVPAAFGVAFAAVTASIVFAAAPDIDQTAARVFYRSGEGFPLAQHPILQTLRSIGRIIPTIAIIGVAALEGLRLFRRRPLDWFHDSSMGYILAVFVAGPLLMANLIFKAHWGRARPAQTDLFGGDHQFTAAWQMSDHCSWNCSFVSGETSMSVALIAFAFVMFKTHRAVAVAVVCAWAALISWNRMAFGAHFLSDVLISAALTMLIALILKALMMDPRDRKRSPSHGGLRHDGAFEAA